MESRIVVSVTGPAGLDDVRELREELEQQTGLLWRERDSAHKGRVLGGALIEIVLVAVSTKLTEVAVEGAVGAAKRVLERRRARQLDPAEASVTRETDLGEPESPGRRD